MKKIFFIIFIVFFNTNVFSKSILPECKGSKIKEYNNCYKTGKYSNGDRYEGEFVNGKFHGKGIYTWPDGRRYEGEYENDKKHGYGSYYWPDGKCYEGYW
jgi:hypothetical protein